MKRFVVQVTVWAMALAGALAVVLPSSASAAVLPPGAFVALAPSRLLDTRTGNGAPAAKVAANRTVSVKVTGRGGVPASGVSAVVLNVTAVAPTRSGFVTVYGPGSRPTASNLNFVTGQTVPNVVIVPVSATGTVKLFNGSPGTTHLLADVAGYYRSGAPTTSGAFGSLAPSRLLDSRTGNGAPAAKVAANRTVSVKVTGRGGVPASGVSAVVLNVTAVAPTRSGFVTVYGPGSRPTVSNMNFVAGQTIANLVIVPVSATGTVKLFNGSAGTTHLLADVAGYYRSGAPTTTGAFGSLAPSHLLDTRTGNGAPAAKVAANRTVSVKVTGRGGVPASGVSAVVLNVTAVAPTRSGFVTVYGPGSRPTASNLNFVAGRTVANLVIVPVSATGTVKLFNGSAGTTHLLADVAGYYRSDTTPAPVTAFKTTAVTQTSVALSWVNPVSATFTGVVIRRAAGPVAPATRTAGVKVADTAASVTTSTDTGLTAATQYSYAAFAHDAAGSDAAAATLTVTTLASPITAPGPVTTLHSTAVTSTTVALAWVNPTSAGFTGVVIRRAVGATAPATRNDGVQVVDTTGATNAHTDTGLTAGTQYSYAAFAHDGVPTDAAAATLTVTTAPGPVTNLTATPSSPTKVQVQLAWTNPNNASFTGVMIRRALGATAPATVTDGQLVAADQATSPFVDAVGLLAETQYSYSVFAHDAAGNSSGATTVTVTTVGAPVTAVVTAVLSVNDSTNGTARTSVAGFEPTFFVAGSTGGEGATIESGTLDYGDGTTEPFSGPIADWTPSHVYLTPGVRTVVLEVTDSNSNKDTDTVILTVFASPTADISSAGGDAGKPIDVAVSTLTPANTVITDYEVDYDDGTGLIFGTGDAPATLKHTYGTAGTFTVTFSAFNDADGIATATTQVVVIQPPVTALSVTAFTQTAITLGWTNPTNAGFTGVMVRRSLGDVPPVGPTDGVAVPVPLSSTAVSFTDTGLTAGTQYSYAVFARDALPHFSLSEEVTQTTSSPPGTPPVASLSVNNSTGATAKATVNGFLARVDLSGTAPSAGHTFTLVRVNYGDGTPAVDFTGDDSTLWDADHEYLTTGVKTATLTVTDSGGGSITKTVTVTVFNQPTAAITGPPTAVTDATVTFGLTAATPVGTVFTDWDLSVDGIQVAFSGVGAPPATFDWHFDEPGTYVVTLSVFNDADGDAISTPITVVVT